MKGWEIRTAGEVSCGSKTKQAYELIKQKILMLEFAPGQPLRELELSERFFHEPDAYPCGHRTAGGGLLC